MTNKKLNRQNAKMMTYDEIEELADKIAKRPIETARLIRDGLYKEQGTTTGSIFVSILHHKHKIDMSAKKHGAIVEE